jgi:hypothetical protein
MSRRERGVVSVFQVGASGVMKLGEAFLADNAHVVAVDPATHRVFFSLRDVGGRINFAPHGSCPP